MTRHYAAEVYVAGDSELAECPMWNREAGVLIWTDIHGKTIYVHNHATGSTSSVKMGGMVGALCNIEGAPWNWLLCGIDRDLCLVNVLTGESHVLLGPIGRPGTRMNDGRCDAAGNFVFGTMDLGERTPIGSFWRLNTVGRVEQLVDGIVITNSICFNPAGDKFYFLDSVTGSLRVADYMPDGPVGESRQFAHIPPVSEWFDGSCTDSRGYVWSAIFGSGTGQGRVECRNTAGKVVEIVTFDAPNVTCCSFGGPSGRHLFISTVRLVMTPEQVAEKPLSGSIFAVEVDVPGPVDSIFKGRAFIESRLPHLRIFDR